MLEIGVDGDDGVAAGVLHSAGQGRFLPEIAGQCDEADAGVRGEPPHRVERAVLRAVVHVDDLEVVLGGERFERLDERGVEERKHFLFAVRRAHETDERSGHESFPQAAAARGAEPMRLGGVRTNPASRTVSK